MSKPRRDRYRKRVLLFRVEDEQNVWMCDSLRKKQICNLMKQGWEFIEWL